MAEVFIARLVQIFRFNIAAVMRSQLGISNGILGSIEMRFMVAFNAVDTQAGLISTHIINQCFKWIDIGSNIQIRLILSRKRRLPLLKERGGDGDHGRDTR